MTSQMFYKELDMYRKEYDEVGWWPIGDLTIVLGEKNAALKRVTLWRDLTY